METAEEMKKWVGALTIAEKRFVKLLGKARAGNTDSQQLALFDWLNGAKPEETIPSDAKFGNNFHTVSNRLKDLILDALRLLAKDANIDALLRTTLDEIAILQQKDLKLALGRQLRRAKKVALEHSRYNFALQCIKIEQQIALQTPGNAMLAQLENLRTEEKDVLRRQADLLELEYLHAQLHARAGQSLAPRGSQPEDSLSVFLLNPTVMECASGGNYLEQALAVNILGIVDLFEGRPMQALARYEGLLTAWQAHPEWQNDQSSLLFFICHCFQSVCLSAPMKLEELRRHLALIPDFAGMPGDVARNFQRMLFHHQFIQAFNTGQLELLPALTLDIERWIDLQRESLTEARILPFYHNILVAQFISGDLVAAKRTAAKILQIPNRKARADIREFAMVLQAVLQYEAGELDHLEYQLRSTKRHFQVHRSKVEFELAVIQFLEKAIASPDDQATDAAMATLVETLDQFGTESQEAVPTLGLMEMRLWAQSRQQHRPLRAVFLEAVEENLKAMS